MRITLFSILILLGSLACKQQKSTKNLPDITSKIDKSTGFIDLTFMITDTRETDSTFIYQAEGLYKTDTVGILVSLKKGLKAGIVNGEMKNIFIKAGISLNSIGSKSDRLLVAMAELYQVDSINHSMSSDLLIFTCANLNEMDINYKFGEYKFKVFMESEVDYSELYINFNFSKNQIYFDEKDFDYRTGVLRFLMIK